MCFSLTSRPLQNCQDPGGPPFKSSTGSAGKLNPRAGQGFLERAVLVGGGGGRRLDGGGGGRRLVGGGGGPSPTPAPPELVGPGHRLVFLGEVGVRHGEDLELAASGKGRVALVIDLEGLEALVDGALFRPNGDLEGAARSVAGHLSDPDASHQVLV